MGKKVSRTAAKVRIETLQSQRKERNSRAGFLLERWGQQERIPIIGDLGASENDPDFIEDQITAEIIGSLSAEKRRIARQHWSEGYSAAEIAELEQQTRSEVRQTLSLILQQVADKVLK